MIGYGWGNVCYIVHFPRREYLLYSKVSGGGGGGGGGEGGGEREREVYYIANIPRGNVYYREGLLCGMFTIRHRHKIENKQNVRYIYNAFSLGIE